MPAWIGIRIEHRLHQGDAGSEHLKHIDLDPGVFPTIRDAGSSKVVFLSSDPEDAMSEAFDARLDAARKALAPLLMDVSKVPVS